MLELKQKITKSEFLRGLMNHSFHY